MSKSAKPAATKRRLNRAEKRKIRHEKWLAAYGIAKLEGLSDADIERWRGHPNAAVELSSMVTIHRYNKAAAAAGVFMTGRPLPDKVYTG